LAQYELQPTSPPDRLVGAITSTTGCLLVSDGSPLAGSLKHLLIQKGVRVALISPAGAVDSRDVAFQSEMPSLQEDAFTGMVAQARNAIGNINLVISFQTSAEPQAMIDPKARTGIEAAFLTARSVQADLKIENKAHGRNAFLTVCRLDGALGMSGSSNVEIQRAGLSGLVRSLSQEWPSVFCRAVDVDPEIAVEDAATALLAEIEDPDRSVIEIGITPTGRQSPQITALALESK
jgi:hypothetical protein